MINVLKQYDDPILATIESNIVSKIFETVI